MIPRGYPVIVQKPPMLNTKPCLLQTAMSDSYSCGWAHNEIARIKDEPRVELTDVKVDLPD